MAQTLWPAADPLTSHGTTNEELFLPWNSQLRSRISARDGKLVPSGLHEPTQHHPAQPAQAPLSVHYQSHVSATNWDNLSCGSWLPMRGVFLG